MSFTTNVFSELVNTYSSWDALRIFLMSAEGGKLRVLSSDNEDLAIIRYTKGVSDFNVSHVPLFRSVVWDKVTNCPVSVAPFKALQGNPAANTPVRITDFVDGTMFHAFRTVAGVRIATRTSLDARGTFYSSRSFADLFDDAFKALGGTKAFLESVLFEGEFASFVLQHPEHKTVAPLAQPRVYVTYFGRSALGKSPQPRIKLAASSISNSTNSFRLISQSPHMKLAQSQLGNISRWLFSLIWLWNDIR